MTTGVLPRQVAFDQGATGPIERASNLDRDLRRDHPYAHYEKVRFSVPVQQGGDAHARSLVRMEEIRESLAIIRQTIGRTKPGEVLRFEVMEDSDLQGEGLGWAEATRGGLLYAVHLSADRTRLLRVMAEAGQAATQSLQPLCSLEQRAVSKRGRPSTPSCPLGPGRSGQGVVARPF